MPGSRRAASWKWICARRSPTAFRGPLPALRQPRDNEITGCEALVRWRHPERGMISPAEFIPIAEETGLINQLGEWVLSDGLRRGGDLAGRHPARGQRFAGPVQERHAGAEDRRRAGGLRPAGQPAGTRDHRGGADPRRRGALAILHQLRAIGVRIALDDFGTGYSSLSYLQRFPFDKIKIDRCFVNDIAEPDGSSCIVQAVVNIAAERNMTTTAEGVETRAAAAIAARARLSPKCRAICSARRRNFKILFFMKGVSAQGRSWIGFSAGHSDKD
jgi:hypothetical protein